MICLTELQAQQVSGAAGIEVAGIKLHPTQWLSSTTAGMFVASGVYTVTAFSANPVGLTFALTTGACLGAAFGVLYDVFHHLEYGY